MSAGGERPFGGEAEPEEGEDGGAVGFENSAVSGRTSEFVNESLQDGSVSKL